MAKKTKKKRMHQDVARRYRDSVTGRFVTKKYAKKNRATTVKEAVGV
jgi:hypothetical protein